MRVLHLSSGNLYGGIETLLVTLARERALCPQMEPEFGLCFEGRVAKELREAGVPVHILGEVRFSRPWTVWSARRALRRLLAANRPDAVVTHACWPHAVFASTVRRAGAPLAIWTHAPVAMTHWLDRKAARVAPDLVIANSRYTAAATRPDFLPGVRREVVYPPVRGAPAGPDRRGPVRRQIGSGDDAVVILMVSRIEPLKGHDLLIEGLGLLKGDPRWVCWVAGSATRPHEIDFLESVRRRELELGLGGRIRWLGERRDVPDLLAAADVYCQPNRDPDSFGITFVEAMLASLPVVTSRVGGAIEVLEGREGLVEPGSAGELASALARLIGDGELRRRLGAGGPERAKALCDPGAQLAALSRALGCARAANAGGSAGCG